jgi:hypothetical protein
MNDNDACDVVGALVISPDVALPRTWMQVALGNNTSITIDIRSYVANASRYAGVARLIPHVHPGRSGYVRIA